MEKVREVNEIIQHYIQPTYTIMNYVYTGAMVVCDELGVQIREVSRRKEETSPPWKCRLERKINDIRKNIGL